MLVSPPQLKAATTADGGAVPMLAIHRLTCAYASRSGLRKASRIGEKVVEGVTLEVRENDALGLVGESGSGKSTLARAVLGLIRPIDGEVRYKGRPVEEWLKKEPLEYRRRVQMVFQDPGSSLDPRMTVGTIVREPLRALHVLGDHVERVDFLLEQVGLDPSVKSKFPHQFSGGERQRIAIARALAPSPELIVADEPVSALDMSVQGKLLNLLSDIREKFGLSVLFISHDLSVVSNVCERVAILQGGHLVESGDIAQVFRSPKQEYTRRLLAAIPEMPKWGPRLSDTSR